jgi:hypothetical protein
VPPSQLTRCPRCKKLFCRSCITEDLREGEYLICLNCARRYVSPKQSGFKGKYTQLTFYLSRKAQWKRWIKLEFSEIEGMIGSDLPASAHKNPEWWTNSSASHTQAWHSIGWNVKEVNPKEKKVIFTRSEILKIEKETKPKKKSPLVSLPEYKPRKKKTPSLTRIAIAQARLENISHKKILNEKLPRKVPPKNSIRKTSLENR